MISATRGSQKSISLRLVDMSRILWAGYQEARCRKNADRNQESINSNKGLH